MKKFAVAILAILYITVSSGVAMSIHYCMGKVASVSLMHTDHGCGMKKDCCKNEFKIVKLNDSHKLFSNEVKIFAPELISNKAKANSDSWFIVNTTRPDLNNHSPPRFSGVSLNILYSVFRI